VGSVFYFGKIAVLHNIEFLVQPFFLYFFFAQKEIAGKAIALFLIIVVAILSQKLTGYINGIAAMSYIGVAYVNRNASLKWRDAIRFFSIALLVTITGLTVLGFFYFKEYLPSGNVNVRLHQYGNVFSAFLDSPVWGQAYTSSSGEVYIEYTRSLNIPTHSDILDLLKQGGVIAFGLWLIGIISTIKLFVRNAMKNTRRSAFFHAMAFLTVSIVLACAVNPLFLTPTFAFIIWGSLALALGVATDTREGQFNES
jgi:O-antigen ligase